MASIRSELQVVETPVIPAPRVSSETLPASDLRAGTRPTGAPDRNVAARHRRPRAWLIAGIALLVGIGIGIPLGVAAAPERSSPRPTPNGSSNLSQLLHVPLTANTSAPIPAGQRGLIQQILTPPIANDGSPGLPLPLTYVRTK